jgi:hypothetical protein
MTLAIILTLLTLAGLQSRPIACVDVCEINEYAPPPEREVVLRQVVLWRWYRGGPLAGHRVAQWWLVHEEPTVIRRQNRFIVRSRGVEFEAVSVRYTKTGHDPDRRDRKKLIESERRPYFAGPGF